MDLLVEKVGNVTVVALKVEFLDASNCRAFKDQINEMLPSVKHLVLEGNDILQVLRALDDRNVVVVAALRDCGDFLVRFRINDNIRKRREWSPLSAAMLLADRARHHHSVTQQAAQLGEHAGRKL